MRNPCEFKINGDEIIILRQDRNEMMSTTYRSDYYDELISQTWMPPEEGKNYIRYMYKIFLGLD